MWIRRALVWAAKKPAPDIIPLGGERTRGQDYYSVTISRADESMLFDHITAIGVVARAWSGNAYDEPTDLLWRDLKNMKFSFCHYLEGRQIERNSPIQFLLAELLRIHYLATWWDRIKQEAYNARRLTVTDQRIDVLRKVIALSQKAADRRITQLGYIASVHGVRVLGHPASTSIESHYQMLFESLVESGDLEIVDRVFFRVRPTALITLSNYEQEERRHRDVVRPQKWVALLTIALVLAGIAQVSVAYLQYLASTASSPGGNGSKLESSGGD